MVGTRNAKNRGDGVDEAKVINIVINKKKDGAQDVEEPIAARTRTKRAIEHNAEDEPTLKRSRQNFSNPSPKQRKGRQNASQHDIDNADATVEPDPEHENEGWVVNVTRAPKRPTAKTPAAAETIATSSAKVLRSTASGQGQAKEATSGSHETVPTTQEQQELNDEEDDEEEDGNVGERAHNPGAANTQSSGTVRNGPINGVNEEHASGSAASVRDAVDHSNGDDDNDDDDDDDEEFPQDQVAGGVLYKLSDLHKIIKLAKTVGTTTSDGYEDEIPRRVPTEQGTKVWRRVRKLLKIYSDAASDDGDDLVESLPLAGPTLSAVQEAVDVMCEDVLSTTERTSESIELLADVFFLIIPKLHDTLWSAVGVYTLRKDTPDSSLEEISVLVRVLLKLSSQSIKHRHAPLGKDVKRTVRRYVYDQPTAANIPALKVLLSTIEGEITSRHEAVETEARQAWIQQQKREQEKLEAESKEQRRKDEAARKDRIQREISEREERRREQLARNFDDPILGALLRQQAMEVLEKQRGGNASRDKARRSFAYSQSMQAEPEGNDEEEFENEFEDDYVEYDGRYGDLNNGDEVEEEEEEVDAELDDNNVERLSIFDHDSRPKTPAPPPWTDKEEELFVKCMKCYSQRDDRFIRTAAMLKKSIDEVIEYAKDFQRAMTDSHDKGQLLDEEHRWTALVWDFEAEANV